MKKVICAVLVTVSGVAIANARSAYEQLIVSAGAEATDQVAAVAVAESQVVVPEVPAKSEAAAESDINDADKKLSRTKDSESQVIYQVTGVTENGASCGYAVKRGVDNKLFAVYTNNNARQIFSITYSGSEGERGEFSNYVPASDGFGFSTPAEKSDGTIVITRAGATPGTAMVKARNCVKRLFWSCSNFSEKCTAQR